MKSAGILLYTYIYTGHASALQNFTEPDRFHYQ